MLLNEVHLKRLFKSEELFVVKDAVGNDLTVYKLQNQAGEDIKGTFYSKELQIRRFNEINEQFCLVLPSNSSLNIFQENKTSYKVQLPYL